MSSHFLFFLPVSITVNYCICAGCTNTNLPEHCVSCFPDKKRSWHTLEEPAFHARLQFVQMKRGDFTVSSGLESGAVVHDAHFKQKD